LWFCLNKKNKYIFDRQENKINNRFNWAMCIKGFIFGLYGLLCINFYKVIKELIFMTCSIHWKIVNSVNSLLSNQPIYYNEKKKIIKQKPTIKLIKILLI